jgi:hypothetical protein
MPIDRRHFLGASLVGGCALVASQADAFRNCKKPKHKPKPEPEPEPESPIDPASQKIIDKFLAEMETGGVYDFVLMWRYREDDPYFFGDVQDVMSGAIGNEEVTE